MRWYIGVTQSKSLQGVQKKRLLAVTDSGICNMKFNGATTTALTFDQVSRIRGRGSAMNHGLRQRVQVRSCSLRSNRIFVVVRSDGKRAASFAPLSTCSRHLSTEHHVGVGSNAAFSGGSIALRVRPIT